MRRAAGLTAERRRRRELVRLTAVEKFEQRVPVAEIAAELRVSERSVQRWRRAWEVGGAPGLTSRGQAARCRLGRGQLAELDRVLDAGPAASGWADQRWTPARIRDLITAKFEVRYTIPGIWYLLRRRGWSCQLGARRAVEWDDGAIEVWRKETWPRVKIRGGPRRLDGLRGRDRPVAEAATLQDLGPTRDHPGHPGPRQRLRLRLRRRAGLLPSRLPHPPDPGGCASAGAARARRRRSPGRSTATC
jgi:transposase